MRCLTLADALRAQGAECQFICREQPGHLIELIRSKGYFVRPLPLPAFGMTQAIASSNSIVQSPLAHAAWLGVHQEQDAVETADALQGWRLDWLVVDHYALDAQWEQVLAPYYRDLLVIDDLADRSHVCSLLLDQNLGRKAADYAYLVPASCQVLAGPVYALLRPEFATLREYSLQRRQPPRLENILISMGGVDQPNATALALEALRCCELPTACHISVIMGPKAPWLEQVRELALKMPRPTAVLININDMAQRMANCDLAIGAAGSTSWERCCLGVPGLMAILAENQQAIAQALAECGAAYSIGSVADQGFVADCAARVSELLRKPEKLTGLSRVAAAVTDGSGCAAVLSWMLKQ